MCTFKESEKPNVLNLQFKFLGVRGQKKLPPPPRFIFVSFIEREGSLKLNLVDLANICIYIFFRKEVESLRV